MRKLGYILLIAGLIFSGCKEKRHFVISKIKSTAKLASTETIIKKMVIGSKERRLLGLVKVGQADFVAETEATVKTGIDMRKLQPEDVVIKGSAIEVTLPHVEVLDFAYPFDKFVINWDITNRSALTKIDVIEMEEFYRMAEIDIRNNLDKMGIVEATQTKTHQMMEGLLKNLGYDEIYISFKEGELIPKIDLSGEPEEDAENEKEEEE